MTDVRRGSADEVSARIDAILQRYPWFATYPVTCPASCARREIASEYGTEARDAWHDYDAAVRLLIGANAGETR